MTVRGSAHDVPMPLLSNLFRRPEEQEELYTSFQAKHNFTDGPWGKRNLSAAVIVILTAAAESVALHGSLLTLRRVCVSAGVPHLTRGNSQDNLPMDRFLKLTPPTGNKHTSMLSSTKTLLHAST